MALSKRLLTSALSFSTVFLFLGKGFRRMTVLDDFYAPKGPAWRFDLISAGIGFGLGLLFFLAVSAPWKLPAAL